MIIDVLNNHSILHTCSFFLEKVDNFSRKIWSFLRKISTIFERNFDSFCKKIWWFFQGKPPTFTGKFKGFSRELERFLHESLMVFTGTFNHFSGKHDDFCSKICWFLFPVSPRAFYHNNSHPSKICQILLQKSRTNFGSIKKRYWKW